MNHQQDLFTDLPRGEQLAALRRLKLSTHTCPSGRVSGAVQKAVLKAIDDHEGSRASFASQKTIAEETGYAVSTVRRGIAALVDRDLITRERPNHWSPNHHRINWTEMQRITSDHDELSAAHGSTLDSSLRHLPELTEASPRVHHEPRNAHLIAQESPTTNRPDEWGAVVAEMFRWGLKTAAQAVDSARERGWSIEYVRELFLEAGGDRDPNRWEPGQLSNWLTGKTPPPFDVFEVLRRDDQRRRIQSDEAESIRASVTQSGQAEGAATWITAGITFRKLTAAGLERFATADEVAGGERMEQIDRQRGAKSDGGEKRVPDVDSQSVQSAIATSEPSEPTKPLGVNFRPRRVPGSGISQRRREIDRAIAGMMP
ncbi:helix-turn-helix domain-containing protein [Allorhodopirellula solitaria]|uniref:Uncharacterized protein n=1 Tax=Allorhodopirellula solitaria TaxID=2527987 RepID=A0A5C5X0M0_9BACT|nr:helix-turn-helix domain-containing protein [Allorhodopirellula solitaria]TWT56496.1 hypothetical protein CA85_40270 [Allorhodopirellula solitaria]